MEDTGGIVVSKHHLTVPITDNYWQGQVSNLYPYPISRGKWYLRPIYISSNNYSGGGESLDLTQFGLDSSAKDFLIRLVCDRALASDVAEKLSLACFSFKNLVSGPLIFGEEKCQPLTDCVDKLVLRLLNFDQNGIERDCTAQIINLLSGRLILGVELIQLKPRNG